MPAVSLSRAQLGALLAVVEPALDGGAGVAPGDGRRRAALERGVDRLRDALGKHGASGLDLAVEELAERLGDLHDADVVLCFVDRVRGLVADVVAWQGVEAVRRRAAREGDGVRVTAAEAVRGLLCGGEGRWRAVAARVVGVGEGVGVEGARGAGVGEALSGEGARGAGVGEAPSGAGAQGAGVGEAASGEGARVGAAGEGAGAGGA